MQTSGKKSGTRSSQAAVKVKGKLPDDFESVARRLECEDDKARFEAKLGAIAKAKNKSNA